MRASQITIFVPLLIIAFCCTAPAFCSAQPQNASSVAGMPSNDTVFSTAAADGTSAPLSSFEKQEERTVFRFELNQPTFPGPRSMAFGPRYIQLTASPATLIVLVFGVFAMGASLYILSTWKRAGAVGSAGIKEEEEAEENRENGE